MYCLIPGGAADKRAYMAVIKEELLCLFNVSSLMKRCYCIARERPEAHRYPIVEKGPKRLPSFPL